MTNPTPNASVEEMQQGQGASSGPGSCASHGAGQAVSTVPASIPSALAVLFRTPRSRELAVARGLIDGALIFAVLAFGLDWMLHG